MGGHWHLCRGAGQVPMQVGGKWHGGGVLLTFITRSLLFNHRQWGPCRWTTQRVTPAFFDFYLQLREGGWCLKHTAPWNAGPCHPQHAHMHSQPRLSPTTHTDSSCHPSIHMPHTAVWAEPQKHLVAINHPPVHRQLGPGFRLRVPAPWVPTAGGQCAPCPHLRCWCAEAHTALG